MNLPPPPPTPCYCVSFHFFFYNTSSCPDTLGQGGEWPGVKLFTGKFPFVRPTTPPIPSRQIKNKEGGAWRNSGGEGIILCVIKKISFIWPHSADLTRARRCGGGVLKLSEFGPGRGQWVWAVAAAVAALAMVRLINGWEISCPTVETGH